MTEVQGINLVDTVTVELGESEYTLSTRCSIFEVPANTASYVNDKVIDAPLALKGGEFYSPNCTMGDWIKVQVVDVDDVLGAGAGVVLNEFVPEWGVAPGVREVLEHIAIKDLPVAGLYLRTTVTRKDALQPACNCMINIKTFAKV